MGRVPRGRRPAAGRQPDRRGGSGGWVRGHLADYKKPRYVEFVDELPRDPNGKVVKRKLRDDYIASLASLS